MWFSAVSSRILTASRALPPMRVSKFKAVNRTVEKARLVPVDCQKCIVFAERAHRYFY